MNIVRKWWNGVLVYIERGEPFMRVVQSIKKYPQCYFDSQNLCWHIAEDYIDVLLKEASVQGFYIDIPPKKNLTSALQSSSGCTFDIETTGLRDDPDAHLVSACIGLSKQDPVEFWVEDPAAERDVLLQLAEALQHMDVIITWNGDRFDIPFLNDRFRKHDIAFQIQTVQSLDLYKVAERMKLAGLIPSASLQTVERFYGIVRPDQLPGRYVPMKYTDYQQSRNPILKTEILQHNREDVLYLLMLSPFIYQGIILQYESAILAEEEQLLDKYFLHLEKLEKLLEEKEEMEKQIFSISAKYETNMFSRPYGSIQLLESACTIQKKTVNSPAIKTFAELREFYRSTLSKHPKIKFDFHQES